MRSRHLLPKKIFSILPETGRKVKAYRMASKEMRKFSIQPIDIAGWTRYNALNKNEPERWADPFMNKNPDIRPNGAPPFRCCTIGF